MNQVIEFRIANPESRVWWRAVAPTLRRAAPPLAWYYAVTLALPLANGAARAGAVFAEHALVVLIIPPALISLASVTREITRAVVCRSEPPP